MTTGNDTQDHQTLVNLMTGLQYKGTYWSRVWSGGDAASIPKYTNVYPPGKENSRNAWSKPPKRGRGKGEHAYDVTLQSWSNPAGYYQSPATNPTQYTTTLHGWVGLPVYTNNWTVQDDYAMIAQLKEDIMGSDFNPAVSLAEANQALGTILAVASAVDGAISHAKRGNTKAAIKSIAGYERNKGHQVPGNLNLGYQYGVKPLLSDAYEAANTLAHLTSVPFNKVYTVTRKRRGTLTSQAPSVVTFGAAYGFDAGKIKAILSEVSTVGLLGLTNPASVVWEKVPYSFVVDWFVPIGAFLDARGVAQSLKGTFVTTRTRRWEARSPKPVGNVSISVDITAGYRNRFVKVQRRVSDALDVPLPEIKPLSDMPSWSRAANAVSLLLQHAKAPRNRGE